MAELGVRQFSRYHAVDRELRPILPTKLGSKSKSTVELCRLRAAAGVIGSFRLSCRVKARLVALGTLADFGPAVDAPRPAAPVVLPGMELIADLTGR